MVAGRRVGGRPGRNHARPRPSGHHTSTARTGCRTWPTRRGLNPPITDLTVTARTGTGKYKSTAYLTIGWTSPTGEDDYAWITASTSGGPEREFWRWPMAPGGPITLDYALPNGTTTFTVRYRDYWNFYPDGFATVTITR